MSLKKFFILLLMFCLTIIPSYADDDSWSKFDDVDKAWDGQKIITNKEYEQVMNALEERKNRKANKKREKNIRKLKGNTLHDNMDPHKDTIDSQTPFEEAEECQVLNIPVNFVYNNKPIEKGYYRVIGLKNDEGVFLELYQSYKLVAKIKARETNDDFDQEFIQFAKIIPYNDSYMKIIFGCLEFNAYAYISIIDNPL